MIRYAILLCAFLTSTFGYAADPIGFTVSDTAFEAPADWKKAASTSPMRKAQFAVVREGIQDKGEVSFITLGPVRWGERRQMCSVGWGSLRKPGINWEPRPKKVKLVPWRLLL